MLSTGMNGRQLVVGHCVVFLDLTWSPQIIVSQNTSVSQWRGPRVERMSNISGGWIVVWSGSSTATGSDWDIFSSFSKDNGTTWSTLRFVNSDAINDTKNDEGPAVASSNAGALMVTWSCGSFCSSVSLDFGLTWSAISLIYHNGGLGDVASFGSKWIAAWNDRSSLGPSIAVTNDTNATWSAPIYVGQPNRTISDFAVAMAASSDGSAVVAWQGDDYISYHVWTFNQGVNWTSTAKIRPNGNSNCPQLSFTSRNEFAVTNTFSYILYFGTSTPASHNFSQISGYLGGSYISYVGFPVHCSRQLCAIAGDFGGFSMTYSTDNGTSFSPFFNINSTTICGSGVCSVCGDVKTWEDMILTAYVVPNNPNVDVVIRKAIFVAPPPPPIIDCSVTMWSPWSSCNATCGDGSQLRERSIILDPTNGGEACPLLEEWSNCSLGQCSGDGLLIAPGTRID